MKIAMARPKCILIIAIVEFVVAFMLDLLYSQRLPLEKELGHIYCLAVSEL